MRNEKLNRMRRLEWRGSLLLLLMLDYKQLNKGKNSEKFSEKTQFQTFSTKIPNESLSKLWKASTYFIA